MSGSSLGYQNECLKISAGMHTPLLYERICAFCVSKYLVGEGRTTFKNGNAHYAAPPLAVVQLSISMLSLLLKSAGFSRGRGNQLHPVLTHVPPLPRVPQCLAVGIKKHLLKNELLFIIFYIIYYLLFIFYL